MVGRKTLLLMSVGLAAFMLYLWFFVGFEDLFCLLSQLNLYQYSLFLALAVGALFAAVIFDSLIWHSLLESLSVKVKLRKLVLYNWIGNFIELILPAATIGGEVARIALSQKETKHDTGIAATTLARLLTFWSQVIVGYPLAEWIGAKSLLKGGIKNPFHIQHQPVPHAKAV